MIKIRVESKVEVARKNLPAVVLEELVKATTYVDPMWKMLRARGIAKAAIPAIIKTHKKTSSHLVVWRGSLGLVIRTLKKYGLAYIITDNRLWLPRVEFECGIVPRDYQEKPVATMIKRQQTVGRAPAGCHPAGTLVLRSDGTNCRVEDVLVGDLLLGPGGTARRVLELHRPYDEVCEVTPVKGTPWRANAGHVLTVYRTETKSLEDISINDYFKLAKYRRVESKLVRSSAVDFSDGKDFDLPVDPYFLGVLLGDGCLTKGTIEVTSNDGEVVYACQQAAKDYGLNCTAYRVKPGAARIWGISQDRTERKKNLLVQDLTDLGLTGKNSSNKFIPYRYLVSSIEDRRSLLAGLLDTDGHLSTNCFDYVTKSSFLAYDILFLARSIGLAAYKNIKWVDDVPYYRISISGDTNLIPTRIERKKATSRSQRKNVLHTGFSVKRLGYLTKHYGFTLSGDGRYLLEDFTVTHNSGKTEMMLSAVAHFKQPTLILIWQERQQHVWLERVEKWFGFAPGGIGGAFKTPIIKPITVGLVQSVRNRLEHLQYLFGTIVCDEVSRFAAPTLRDVVNAMPAAVRIGASDDERRRDQREFLLYDTFGPKGWQVKFGTGQCDVDIISVPVAYRPRVITSNWSTLIGELTDNSVRNKQIVNLAVREANDGRRVLIFSDRLGHCEELKAAIAERGVAVGLIIGGSTVARKEEAELTERGLLDGSISVGIGTKVAEQSINIPPLDTGIMTCASADPQLFRFKQMRGRVARPHPGKQSRLYYFWDYKSPILKRKISNIKRKYRVKRMCFPFNIKEEDKMAEKAAITLDTLKRGCKELSIKIPKGATPKKLTDLIKRELAKNKLYKSYLCGACMSDIIDKIPICPFCSSKFKDMSEEEDEPVEPEEEEDEVEEDEVEEPEDEDDDEDDDEEEEDEVEEENEDDDEDDEDEDEDEDEVEENEDEDEDDEDEDEDEDDEDEDDEDEDDEDEDEVEEAPKPAKKAKGEVSKTDVQKEKEKRRRDRLAKEAQKEQQREQIKSELPYSDKQLKCMKRTTLLMIAGVLGIKNPIKLGGAEDVANEISKVQDTKYGAPKAKKKKGKKSKKSSK